MAMTFRQMMNSVLGSIGSTQIPSTQTTITDPYQLQVATFLNQIREEVEDAWNWRALWVTYNINYLAITPLQTIPVPIFPTLPLTWSAPLIAGVTTANLSAVWPNPTGPYQVNFNGTDVYFATFTNGSANVTWSTPLVLGATATQSTINTTAIIDSLTLAVPNARSRTVRMQDKRVGKEVALCFDVTSFGIPFPLEEMKKSQTYYFNTVLNQAPVAYSTGFTVDNTKGDQMNLLVYPPANANRIIQLTLCTPVPRIDPTVAGSTGGLDTLITVPTQPIEYGTIWYALQERGEELGTSTVFTEERFRVALDDAIARDQDESGGIEMIVA
jgi:hypothetical protein